MAASILYLFWGAASPKSFRWSVQQDGTTTKSGESSLSQLAEKYSALRTTLIVPSEELLVTSVSIPARNQQKLRQAVPYALEEQLIDDVDELHYAIGSANRDGQRSVVVVSQQKMAEWLQPFDEAALRLTSCLPDIFVLPQSDNGWTLLIEDERALLRTAVDAGYALPVEGLSELINAELANTNEDSNPPPAKITLFDCRSDQSQLDDDQFNVAIERKVCTNGIETVVAPELQKAPAINLLQGEFGPSDQMMRHLKPWRVAAVLISLALLLGITGWGVEYQRLIAQEQALKSSMEKLYRDTFPQARKVFAPRFLMEQKLAQLNKGQGAAEFTHLMVNAIPVLLKVEGVEVEVLRYKQNSLELELHLKDLPSIDKLKSLMEEAGFQFQVKNASSAAGRVTGKVNISRSAS